MSATHAPGLGSSGPAVAPEAGLGTSERLYAGLLRAYPAHFRTRYGSEMVQLFADQLRDARGARGSRRVASTWFRTLVDLTTSAIGEHLRRDRTMGQSLATFEPSRSMRLLGLFAIVGGGLLLWAFISWAPFPEIANNTVRLVLFGLTGAAIALAFHARQAAVAPRLATVATGIVVAAGIWYTSWTLLSFGNDSPFAGAIGFIGSLASFSLWASAAVFGAIALRIGALWRGMTRWFAGTARMAALLLVIGGLLSLLGDDRWGFVDNETYGAIAQQAAVLGVFLTGAGWALLGVVLVLGGRGGRGENRTA